MDTNFGIETMNRIERFRREADLYRLAAGQAGDGTRTAGRLRRPLRRRSTTAAR